MSEKIIIAAECYFYFSDMRLMCHVQWKGGDAKNMWYYYEKTSFSLSRMTSPAIHQIPTHDFIIPEIASPLREAFIAVRERQRSPRKKRKYSDAEVQVLERYKHEYRKKTTTKDRQHLLQNYILVDIFNFWYKMKEIPADISEEDLSERIKVRKKRRQI